ncbi:spore wall protein 2-like [Salvia splendens]|uniref:spore wall protein 2-like n=1 Tax=Salvia splendens TaxID=180675 RepID=UPI001C280DED|nr:spore wall protein 2-like [Salvia splendens]
MDHCKRLGRGDNHNPTSDDFPTASYLRHIHNPYRAYRKGGHPTTNNGPVTPVAELSSPLTHADSQAKTSVPAPDLIHAEEAGDQKEEEREEFDDEGNQEVEGESEEEGDDHAEGEELEEGENEWGNNSAGESDEGAGTVSEGEDESEGVAGEEIEEGDKDEEVGSEDVSKDALMRTGKNGSEEVNEEPESEETPVDERTTRRATHRSRQVEELVTATGLRKLKFDPSEGEDVTEEDTEERYATERKRNRKNPRLRNRRAS